MAGRRLPVIGLLCGMCAACASAPDKVTSVQDYNGTFLCEGGQAIHVRFTPFNAVLDSGDQSVAMVQQPAADGYRYTGAGQSIAQHGHEAAWTDGKGVIHHCRDAAVGPTAH